MGAISKLTFSVGVRVIEESCVPASGRERCERAGHLGTDTALITVTKNPACRQLNRYLK